MGLGLGMAWEGNDSRHKASQDPGTRRVQELRRKIRLFGKGLGKCFFRSSVIPMPGASWGGAAGIAGRPRRGQEENN